MAETVCSPRRLEGRSSPTDAEGKQYFIRTFGCQMNEHDTERIAGLLSPTA